MKIAVGADHGGFPFKQIIVDELSALGHTVVDCGAASFDPTDDYPISPSPSVWPFNAAMQNAGF